IPTSIFSAATLATALAMPGRNSCLTPSNGCGKVMRPKRAGDRETLDRTRCRHGCPVQTGVVRSMNDVTRILSAIEGDERNAGAQLFPIVYDELRQLAAQPLAQEKPGQTLQPTALVHEVYLRLVDVEQAQHWNSRRHFFAAAAEAMRRILVEQARRKNRQKHGGGRARGPPRRPTAVGG